MNGVSLPSAMKACHLYINHPDHAFDLSPDDGNIVLKPESYPPLERLASGHGQPSPSLP